MISIQLNLLFVSLGTAQKIEISTRSKAVCHLSKKEVNLPPINRSDLLLSLVGLLDQK